MNRSPIDWCNYSWNPITGCLHGCSYCYARSIARRFGIRAAETAANHVAEPGQAFPWGFDPTFYPHRLVEPARVKKPAHIFACSMGDMFGEWVPDSWIQSVLAAMDAAPWHTYTVLSKNPKRIQEDWYDLRMDFLMLGTSIDGDTEPSLYRLRALEHLPAVRKVVSIEPYLYRMTDRLRSALCRAGLSWVIIGGQTGRNAFVPPRHWIDPIMEMCRNIRVPVFVKRNADPTGKLRREWPEGVPH